MEIKEYFSEQNQTHWLEQIRKSDWSAGEFLAGMVRDNTFFDFAGEGAKILLLTEGETLVSYCTFAPMDDIKQTELSPWIGFVYTAPEFRGHRYFGKLMAYAEELARQQGKEYTYISTAHTEVYEKYGYEYFTDLPNVGGTISRVYRKNLS